MDYKERKTLFFWEAKNQKTENWMWWPFMYLKNTCYYYKSLEKYPVADQYREKEKNKERKKKVEKNLLQINHTSFILNETI